MHEHAFGQILSIGGDPPLHVFWVLQVFHGLGFGQQDLQLGIGIQDLCKLDLQSLSAALDILHAVRRAFDDAGHNIRSGFGDDGGPFLQDRCGRADAHDA